MPPTRTEYGKRLDTIHARIADRLGEPPVVFYNAYKSDANNLPLDNLDETTIEGKVQFPAPYWGEGQSYTSAVVDSPTWLDVAVLANEMLKVTGDYHHQFLEDVDGEDHGVKIASFSMGS